MRRVLLLSLLALAGAGRAQLFPPVPVQGTVYDGAGLLTPSDVNTINALSNDFKRDTGAPIVVATLPSLKSVGADGTGIEAYATMLFNQWRIGRNDANGGILLLVSAADHKARIELGKDWKHDYDARAHEIMQGTILPAFKQGQLSEGIVAGCQALAKLAGANAPSAETNGASAQGDPDQAGLQDNPMSSGGVGFPGGWLCVLVPVGLIVVVALARNGRRRAYGGPDQTGTYGSPFVDDGSEDAAFLTGMVAGQAMSQPPYDSAPYVDDSPAFDPSGSGFDPGGDSFDSGSSGGGGDTGSW